MGKIKLLLCDDSAIFLLQMSKFIEKSYPDKFEISIVNDKKFNLKIEYDVYFLDIEMPTINGFELAKKIHKKYPRALLIFLTTHEELSMEGYEYSAFRFISKNRTEYMMPSVLDAIIKEFVKYNEFVVAKRNDNIIESILVANIMIIISEGNYLTFFSKKNVYRKRMKMKEMSEKYDLSTFLYTERGVLVNVRYVHQYNKKRYEIILMNEKKMIIGKKYRKDFLSKYLQIKSINFFE